MSSPYPTAYQIEEMFSNRVDTDIFNTYFADNPEILMVGDDFHLGGRHSSVQSWHDSIYGRVTAAVKIETLRNEVLRVIGGGESPWAAVESVTTATTNSGESSTVVVIANFYGFHQTRKEKSF